LVVGFIFIKTAAKKEHKAFRELQRIPEIIELTPLFGEYDLLAKIEAHDFNMLSRIVMNKIRKIDGVEDTMTLPGIKI
jgi:DNA-binding Lrp family transcriptional regulator